MRPISKICFATGVPLVPGDTCWSVLMTDGDKLQRHDYSLTAWTGPPENALGYWRTMVPVESTSVNPRLDADSLFDYFLQLCESPNVVEQDYLYVLALLLLRKRRLILESAIEVDDQPAMRLIATTGEGPFDIVEKELADDQILQLQSQLFGTADAA